MRYLIAFALAVGALALAGCGNGNNEAPGPPLGITTIGVRIEDGKPVGGIVRAAATKDDNVQLVFRSDVADEVHLHGYDLHQDVSAGGTARIRFKADIAGVFEAELESRKLQILQLTVK
jgi:hypothetical protein